MALQGIDISENDNITDFSAYDFVIVKSSEGLTQDTKMEEHADNVLASNKLLGFYHVARLDEGNTPEEEAEAMLGFISNYLGNCVIILYYTSGISENYEAWLLTFLQYVAVNSPARPILSVDTVPENFESVNEIRNNGFGLWIRDITNEEEPTVKNWADWAIWQYEDGTLNEDKWAGTETEWATFTNTTATTYQWISGNRFLTQKEMQNNIQCLLQYFSPKGWTNNAIAALAANMEEESTINPGIWEGLRVGGAADSHGFGLVQWTPYTKITEWLSANGYARDSGKGQCDRIIAEQKGVYGQWIQTSSYPISFNQFAASTADPGELAYAFMYNYERPGTVNQPWRKEYAAKWFTFLGGAGGGGNAWVFVPRLDAKGMEGNYRWYRDNPFYQAGFGLPNCTCYCWGRFYELEGVAPNLPLGDANTWFPRAVAMGKKTGQTPQLGAIICTYYPIGGHVANVEVINEDGSIVVSNSGYGSAYFWTETLYPPNYVPSWAPSGAYVQGFIYLDITPISPQPEPEPPPLTRTRVPFILNTNIWLKI